MSTEIFNFTKNGLQKASPRPQLPFGYRIYQMGYDTEGYYAVISDNNENGVQKTVYMGSSEYRKSTMFSYIDKYSRPLSKKFGIGTYYDDLTNHVYRREQVEAQIKIANEYDVVLKNKAIKKEERRLQTINDLKIQYNYLELNPNNENKITKSNIVKLLKHHFPNQKFSIRKDYYNSYTISWVNGISVESVQRISNNFNSYSFDESGDYYDPTPDEFNGLFGGLKYISLDRSFTEDIYEIFNTVNDRRGEHNDQCTRLNQFLHQCDIPDNYLSINVDFNSMEVLTFEVQLQQNSVTTTALL